MLAVLLFSLGPSALADNSSAHVITITNASAVQHQYEAYQIFAGDYHDRYGLANIVWGSGVDGEALLDALKNSSAFTHTEAAESGSVTVHDFAGCSTAAEAAEILAGYDTEKAGLFADVVSLNLRGKAAGASSASKAEKGYSYSIPVAGDGYYLIKDKDRSVTADGEAYTDYILQVVGDVTVAAKSGTVEVEKTVATGGYACRNTDAGHVHSIGECGLKYANSNTAKVGDIVSFRLKSTIPEEASAYDYYFFIFGDTLSSGLSFDLSSANLAVLIGGETAEAGTDYTVSTEYGAYTFAVALADAKSHAGEEVIVSYEARVNEKAVVGLKGNSNEVTVEFSRNPNKEYGGQDKPDGFPGEDNIIPDNRTPVNMTKTYVTQMKLLKVDGKDNSKTLSGAVFAFSGTAETAVVRSREEFTQDNAGTYYKLKDQSYTDTAPVQEHMELQTDRASGGYVICSKTDSRVKYTIGGVSYRPASREEIGDTDVALYVHIASNEALYENSSVRYSVTTKTVYECASQPVSFTGTTDTNGSLVISGLNAGKYTITEIVAPDGYNLLKKPIRLTIACELPEVIVDGTEKCTWIYSSEDVSLENAVSSDGTVQITVENQSGTLLPSTGGIGTQLFYIAGSLLTAAAMVLLITRKRMSAENKK